MNMQCHLVKPVFFILFIFFSCNSAWAGTEDNNLFNLANEAYSRGDFAAATELYEQLTATSGYGAGVLFNLGNSYFQSGQIGKAVLNYERALRLTPSDSDIQTNLKLVRKESGLFPREYSWIERFFKLLGLDQWTMAALVSLALLSIFQLASIKLPIAARTRQLVTSGGFILLLLCLSGALSRHRQWQQPFVVIGADSRLLISPFSASTPTGSIQQGRLVYPAKSHAEFSYVTDETGRKGWISLSAIESVTEGS